MAERLELSVLPEVQLGPPPHRAPSRRQLDGRQSPSPRARGRPRLRPPQLTGLQLHALPPPLNGRRRRGQRHMMAFVTERELWSPRSSATRRSDRRDRRVQALHRRHPFASDGLVRSTRSFWRGSSPMFKLVCDPRLACLPLGDAHARAQGGAVPTRRVHHAPASARLPGFAGSTRAGRCAPPAGKRPFGLRFGDRLGTVPALAANRIASRPTTASLASWMRSTRSRRCSRPTRRSGRRSRRRSAGRTRRFRWLRAAFPRAAVSVIRRDSAGRPETAGSAICSIARALHAS